MHEMCVHTKHNSSIQTISWELPIYAAEFGPVPSLDLSLTMKLTLTPSQGEVIAIQANKTGVWDRYVASSEAFLASSYTIACYGCQNLVWPSHLCTNLLYTLSTNPNLDAKTNFG